MVWRHMAMKRSYFQAGRLVTGGRSCRPTYTYPSVRRCSTGSQTSDRKGSKTGGKWQKYTFPAILGVGCIGLVQVRRKAKEHGVVVHIPFADEALVRLKFSSYRLISRLAGRVGQVELPFAWMRTGAFSTFSKVYGCNTEEAALPFDQYSTFSAFFQRELKTGARQLDGYSKGGVVTSPVDAVVLCQGSTRIDEETRFADVLVDQVKGVAYSAEELVGVHPQGMEKTPKMLQYIVFYLAPGDYHRYHSPVDWKVLQRRHFPGELQVVRPWAVQEYPGLYCKNERVVLNGVWQGGYYFGFAAVGALNVGSINIYFDPSVKTNEGSTRSLPKVLERNYPEEIALKRGEMVGSFNFGSTIVLVFESSEEFQFTTQVGDRVKVGQRVGVDSSTAPELPTFSAPPWPGKVRIT